MKQAKEENGKEGVSMDIEGTRVVDESGWAYWMFFERGNIACPIIAINENDFIRIIEREGYKITTST